MFLFLAIVTILIVILIYADTRKPKNYPKGPKWLPIVGNFPMFRKKLERLGFHHLVWEELAKEHGNVVGLRLGRTLIVTVSGAEAVKEVLSRDEFNGRPDGFFFRFRTFGKRLGIVFADGAHWQKQRKFSIQHLRNFGYGRQEMAIKIEAEARELVESLRKRCDRPVPMHNVFDIGVINVLWAMIAGERFELDDARLIALMEIIHDAFKLIDMSGGMLNQMPFLRYIAPDACGFTKIVEILTKLFTFLKETVEEHRRSVCNLHTRDLIDAFIQRMNLKTSEADTFTDEQLLSLCLDLFMAGSETTSNTLSFTVLYMLKYTDVQKKVQNEMDEVVGRNRWPSLQDRVRLTYTEAVIMEIQRMANIPPLGVAHRSTKNATLLGYTIPEGTIILTSLHSIHTDPEFWVDPQVFRPERFLKDGKLHIPDQNFAPFGYGKRRCLGESLAKANLFLFFTALLHNFDMSADPTAPEIDLVGLDGVTLSPKPFSAILTNRHI